MVTSTCRETTSQMRLNTQINLHTGILYSYLYLILFNNNKHYIYIMTIIYIIFIYIIFHIQRDAYSHINPGCVVRALLHPQPETSAVQL